PKCADLPIVIVTNGSLDFEVRVQSALSGGSDLISKPFTPSEVVVKAFTSALRRRLGPIAAPPNGESGSTEAQPPQIAMRRNGTQEKSAPAADAPSTHGSPPPEPSIRM